MCTLFFALNAHPDYPFVFAGNRDEAYQRTTQAAHWWESPSFLLAGKDLEGGGTWTGVTQNGRFAALTNYRDPQNIRLDAPSRGHLVTDFLKNDLSIEAYLAQVQTISPDFNGFNLVVGTMKEGQLGYYSNVENKIHVLRQGVFGLSNALLDSDWPKVQNGKQAFQKILAKPTFEADTQTAAFMEMLTNRQTYPDASLPQTGVPLAWERRLSALFIQSPTYGTRTSTVILVDHAGRTQFYERSFDPEKNVFDLQTFTFGVSS